MGGQCERGKYTHTRMCPYTYRRPFVMRRRSAPADVPTLTLVDRADKGLHDGQHLADDSGCVYVVRRIVMWHAAQAYVILLSRFRLGINK